jgi:hypothetical protein
VFDFHAINLIESQKEAGWQRSGGCAFDHF